MVGMGVLFAVIVVQIIVQIAAPVSDDQDLGDAVAFPDQGRRHLVAGETFDQYNSFPPTSARKRWLVWNRGFMGPTSLRHLTTRQASPHSCQSWSKAES